MAASHTHHISSTATALLRRHVAYAAPVGAANGNQHMLVENYRDLPVLSAEARGDMALSRCVVGYIALALGYALEDLSALFPGVANARSGYVTSKWPTPAAWIHPYANYADDLQMAAERYLAGAEFSTNLVAGRAVLIAAAHSVDDAMDVFYRAKEESEAACYDDDQRREMAEYDVSRAYSAAARAGRPLPFIAGDPIDARSIESMVCRLCGVGRAQLAYISGMEIGRAAKLVAGKSYWPKTRLSELMPQILESAPSRIKRLDDMQSHDAAWHWLAGARRAEMERESIYIALTPDDDCGEAIRAA